jgi:predicted transcriptional regulator
MKPARDLAQAAIVRLEASMTLPELAIILPSYLPDACFVVMDGSKIHGVITVNAGFKRIRRPNPEATVAEIASQNYALISADTSVFKF